MKKTLTLILSIFLIALSSGCDLPNSKQAAAYEKSRKASEARITSLEGDNARLSALLEIQEVMEKTQGTLIEELKKRLAAAEAHVREQGQLIDDQIKRARKAEASIDRLQRELSLAKGKGSSKLELVRGLEFSSRGSLLNENDQVLRIRNPQRESIDVYLKCYARNGRFKTIFVSVPASGVAEVGILEGWSFKQGDRFEVVHSGEVIHSMHFN